MASNTKISNRGSREPKTGKKPAMDKQIQPQAQTQDWWKRLNLAEYHHLALLLDEPDEDEFESHRELVAGSWHVCAFCDRGVPNEALRAAFVEDDSSLLREFIAQHQ